MAINILINPVLRRLSRMPDTVPVKGKTVGECLEDLQRQYSDTKSWLFDATSLFQVSVNLNGQETIVLDKQGLSTLVKDNDEIQVFAIIGGG